VEEGGKKGTVVGEERVVEGLPPNAESAVPGVPTFLFENVAV
jgi:leucyl-tRNA synthetase